MKKFLSCFLVFFIIVGSLFAVTDSDILAASKLLEISYDDLKVFADQYHTQKDEGRANGLSENEIINRLKTIPGVKGVHAATETNDPNGGLNKPGKYVSAIYFELENVDQRYFDANLDIVGKGTDCGGQIEVYANAEDAKRRDDYLANFDGTFFATFHHLYGTIVIRLSDDLTATEQRNMKDAIISALSKWINVDVLYGIS